MRKISVWSLILMFECMVIFLPSRAFALASGFYSGLASINAMAQGAAQATAFTSGGVTTVSSAAMEAATVAGLGAISVPSVATAGVTAARLASLAGTAVKLGSWVGVAAVVIPWIAQQTGIVACPAPDFFCKPGPQIKQVPTVDGGWADHGNGYDGPYATPSALCDAAYARRQANTGYLYTVNNGFVATDANDGQCMMATLYVSNNQPYQPPIAIAYPTSPNKSYCPDGFALSSGQCVKAGTPIPATVDDIATPLAATAAADSAKQQQLFQMERDQGAPIFQPGDPATVTMQPVTTPPQTTTRTIMNPDGTTSTRQTTVITTVTPQVSGNTVDNITATYPYTTTTTTTTTNNTTNVTTVNVTNQTGTAPPVPPPPVIPVTPQQPITTAPATSNVQIPTDYNRENTQQQILKSLDGTGVPDGSGVDQDGALKSIDDQNNTGNSAITNITPDSVGLFNWVPQIPTAECEDPTVPAPITGNLVTVPICKPVNTFSTFISAVICFFAVVGSVREVQAAMKA